MNLLYKKIFFESFIWNLVYEKIFPVTEIAPILEKDG